MPFSFPASPSVGDQSTQNGRTYSWSGYAWEIVATPAALAASVITSGTLDIARIPTGTSSSTVCVGNDARLSDARTPTSHAHGNITNAGAIGSTADQIVVTTTSGVLTAVSAATARTTLSVQPTASPTFTGTLTAATCSFSGTVTVTSPLVLTGTVAGNVRQLRMQTSGSTRWEVGPGFDAESGSNVGSTLWITRWSDAGAFLGTPISIARATGVVTFESQVLVTAGSGSAGSYKPGVAISGDDDTGIQQIGGANTLSIVTDSRERIRFTSGGTTEVRANSGSISHLFTYNENGGEIILYDETQTAATLIDQISTDTRVLELVNGSNLKLGLGSNNSTGLVQFMRAGYQEAMRIDASGNVGIGTSSIESGFMLHVQGDVFISNTAAGTITKTSIDRGDQRLVLGAYFEAGVGQYSFISSTNNAETGNLDLQLRTGTTARMTIGFDGKITAAGVYNNTVGATNRDVYADSGGLIGYVSSIRESKTDIVTLDDVSWLSALSPVSYRYRKKNADGTYSDEADGVTDYGLIAEDVEAVRPELCFYDDVDGQPQLRGVTYSKLITPMLRYIQQLEQRIAALEERLNHA